VRLIHAEEDSLTGVAYGAGFYDQALFCRCLNPSPTSHPVNTGNKKLSAFSHLLVIADTALPFGCILFAAKGHLHHPKHLPGNLSD
jgi:hypothetical protein